MVNRSRGRGCPYCTGQRPTESNNFAVEHPELIKQWHPTKNDDLTLDKLTPSSTKKIWWICSKEHEWQAKVSDRHRGSDCPYCRNRRTSIENSLTTVSPMLAKQWHPERNENLKLTEVNARSAKKVWWICDKGHEWVATIRQRFLLGTDCPFCKGQKATEEDCLAVSSPSLSKEWHPTKNGTLTPFDVKAGSSKKAWWICSKGHEWQANISSRHMGSGCPKCGLWKKTSFGEQAIIFYLQKGFVVTNRQIFKYQNKRVEVDIYIGELNLAIEYDGYFFHSKKGSVQRDTLKNKAVSELGIKLIRVREGALPKIENDNCISIFREYPFNMQSLEQVLRSILDTLSKTFRSAPNIVSRVDLIKDTINLQRDTQNIYNLLDIQEVENSLENVNPKLSKEWHPYLNTLQPSHVTPNSNFKVWWVCEKGHEWQAAVNDRNRGRNCPYCVGKRVCNDNSLRSINPELADEWHPTKNGNLTPDDVTSHSRRVVWWKCKCGNEWKARVVDRNKGEKKCIVCLSLGTLNPILLNQWHTEKNIGRSPFEIRASSGKKVWWKCSRGHEWMETIASRNTKGYGCPFCSSHKVSPEKSLAEINPELSKEWNHSKNFLTPSEVTAYSNKKVWWKCINGHEWQATIFYRQKGRGCPYCKGLLTSMPELANYWHPSKNGTLTPDLITLGSNKKIWWKCSNGHEWLASPNDLTRKRKTEIICPNCRKLTK